MESIDLLLRQIHPLFFQNGKVLSPAFRPKTADNGKLSVSDGNIISPENAWKRYTQTLGLASCGVLGVDTKECEICQLSVCEAPVENQPDHMEIDFSHLSKSQTEKAAKTLRDFAENRGWLFRNQL